MNDFCIFYFHNSKSVKICLFNDATNGPKSSKIDKSFGKCVPSFAVTTRILVFESFFLPTNDDFPPVDRSTESSSFKKYKKTQTKSCPKQKKHLGRLGTQRDQIYKNLKVSGHFLKVYLVIPEILSLLGQSLHAIGQIFIVVTGQILNK